MKLGDMTDADKGINPLHFGNDPADTRIIGINADSNPGLLLVEAIKVQRVRSLGVRWRMYALSECYAL